MQYIGGQTHRRKLSSVDIWRITGAYPGKAGGPAPLTTRNEAPAPKFYKIEAPEWQF